MSLLCLPLYAPIQLLQILPRKVRESLKIKIDDIDIHNIANGPVLYFLQTIVSLLEKLILILIQEDVSGVVELI